VGSGHSVVADSSSDVAFSEKGWELVHAREGLERDGGWLNEEVLAQSVL
jgi:hypothetical protein